MSTTEDLVKVCSSQMAPSGCPHMAKGTKGEDKHCVLKLLNYQKERTKVFKLVSSPQRFRMTLVCACA